MSQQQPLLSVKNRHDHRRVDTRVLHVLAAFALALPPGETNGRATTAAGAKPRTRMPRNQARAHREQLPISGGKRLALAAQIIPLFLALGQEMHRH